MKNKGFTLVELLAIVVIISFLVVLVLPRIMGSINTKKVEVDETTKALILNATKAYREDNALKYPEIKDSEYCVYLETLTDTGYLASPIRDINNKDITNKVGIKLTYDNENNKFKYEIVENSACANIEFEQAANKCIVSDDENCKTCVLLRYLSDSHYLSAEIIDELDKEKAIVKEAIGEFEYIDEEDCLNRIILIAAREYVEEHPTVYRMINGNTYCLPVSLLQSKFTKYLNDNYSDYFNRKSVRIEIKDGSSSYTVVNKEDCSEALACGIYTSIPSNLTPVKYDENQEEWIATSTDDPEWYDYTNQKCANAVVLRQGITKNIGDTINVNGPYANIPEASLMFVYIPRYSYTQKSDSDIYDIKCISSNEKETGSGENAQNYKTHPAFTYKDRELSGLWVGKFSAGTLSSETYATTTCDNDTCTNSDNVVILPNTKMICDQNYNSYYKASASLNRVGNAFGFLVSEGNVHMEGYNEYEAIAFLYQSKYGKIGNSNYTGVQRNIYPNPTTHTDAISGRACVLINGGCVGSYKYDVDDLKTYTSVTGLSSVSVNNSFPSNGNWSAITNGYETPISQKTSWLTGNTIEKDVSGEMHVDFKINASNVGKLSFSYGTYGTNKRRYGLKYLLYYCKDCTSNTINETSKYLVLTSAELRADDARGTIDMFLEPGQYRIVFDYTQYGLLGSCTDCYGTVEDFYVKQTTTFTKTSSFTINNGVGASTTGNIYGVYDIIRSEKDSEMLNTTDFSDTANKAMRTDRGLYYSVHHDPTYTYYKYRIVLAPYTN